MKKQTKKGNIDGKKTKKEKHIEKEPKGSRKGCRTDQQIKSGRHKIRTDKTR